MKTTTHIPAEYKGDFKPPMLNVPQFEVKLLTVKTKHIPFMWHVENISTFKKFAK